MYVIKYQVYVQKNVHNTTDIIANTLINENGIWMNGQFYYSLNNMIVNGKVICKYTLN